MQNPFSPGAGSPPPELAGRGPLLEQAQLVLGRVKAGRPERSFLLVGLRGVGKTVLLNKVRELADKLEYKAVLIEAHEGKPLAALLLPAIRQILISFDHRAQISQKAKRGLRVLRSFFDGLRLKYHDIEIGIDVNPEEGIADSGNLESDLSEVFLAVGEAAAERSSAVALIVDEMQYLNEEELSALIMAMHQISQRQLPLVLVGAGLPNSLHLPAVQSPMPSDYFNFPKSERFNRQMRPKPSRSPPKSKAFASPTRRYRRLFFKPKVIRISCRNGAIRPGTSLRTRPSASTLSVTRLDNPSSDWMPISSEFASID